MQMKLFLEKIIFQCETSAKMMIRYVLHLTILSNLVVKVDFYCFVESKGSETNFNCILGNSYLKFSFSR